MRLTLALLGWELDLSLAPSDAPTPVPDGASLDGGTTASYPVGFTAAYDVPADLPWVERNNGWGDEEE
jgi:hypothetical protein